MRRWNLLPVNRLKFRPVTYRHRPVHVPAFKAGRAIYARQKIQARATFAQHVLSKIRAAPRQGCAGGGAVQRSCTGARSSPARLPSSRGAGTPGKLDFSPVFIILFTQKKPGFALKVWF